MNDGDTLFGLSTALDDRVRPGADEAFHSPAGRAARLNPILDAGARCVAEACSVAVVGARGHVGGPPGYLDLCPSAWSA
jgi:L-aminopeptidase/D-esterase-like protein